MLESVAILSNRCSDDAVNHVLFGEQDAQVPPSCYSQWRDARRSHFWMAADYGKNGVEQIRFANR